MPKNINILIVSESPKANENLAKLLEQIDLWHFEINNATPQNALKIIINTPIDIIFSFCFKKCTEIKSIKENKQLKISIIAIIPNKAQSPSIEELSNKQINDYLFENELSANTIKRAVWHAIIQKNDNEQTERKLRKNQDKLQKALKKAEEADMLKTAFLANMSHEIRTPMNAIVGFSNLLTFPDLTAEKKQYFITQINKNTDLLLSLIDDLIDISKIEAKQINIKPSKTKLSILLKELLSKFLSEKSKQNKIGIDIIMSLPQDLNNEYFLTYPHRIKQILTHLLNNALKFTEHGEIEFGYEFSSSISPNDIVYFDKDISIKEQEKVSLSTNNFIRFYVKDTGIGIQTESQKSIFEPFRKLPQDREKLYRGIGVGLTISKKLIDLLGGKIWVESQINQGAVFYFELPFKLIKYTNAENTLKTPTMQHTKFKWENKIILIAEDEETNYMYLEQALAPTQAQIIWAKNGKEAVDVCNNKDVNLILMDIKMPKMDGYTAIKEIKKIKKEIKIIAQTAYALANEKQEILQAGCDDYLTKPIKQKQLLETIEKFI